MSAGPTGAPWMASYAGHTAAALVSGLELLDGDDVTVHRADGPGPGFVLRVRADPPRAVHAVRWSAESGWWYSVDPPWRGSPRWFRLPVGPDADAVTLAEVVADTDRAAAPGIAAG